MDRIDTLTINWDRCVHVDDVIDDELVRKLTPQILALRQKSNDPITVAINSPGGSLASMEVLLGLLAGPNQDDLGCMVITVATSKAYSAAANLLSSGSYAIALPHSEVLFHDVRYSGMEDVTSVRALKAARQLESANEGVSLKLANHVFKRLMWNYIDLKHHFGRLQSDRPELVVKYQTAIEACDIKPIASVRFDPALYVALLASHLSKANFSVIDSSMAQLRRWGGAVVLSKITPIYAQNAGEVGLLDGCQKLYREMRGENVGEDFGGGDKAEALGLFVTLMTARLVSQGARPLETNLEESLSDFKLVSSLNDPKHRFTANKLMLRHKHIFFNSEAAKILEGGDDAAKEKIIEEAAPLVAVMWHICVLMCRELFNGEHTLTPAEAQILGLVNEVPGLKTMGSLRDFYVLEKTEADAKASRS